jgi:adenosylcobinamide kinase/adenosylcobinamide-phosphate guanylyltransferase
MRTLISGGAGSGKSALAEDLALKSTAAVRVYLATMTVWGAEDRERVERHRALRWGKGFVTVERTERLDELTLPADCVVLLEDLGNLAANECFGGQGFPGAQERILAGLEVLSEQCRDLIVVSNELFSDGIAYPAQTQRYLELMAALNRRLAEGFDRVVEVTAGLPIVWKGVLE